MSDRIHYLVQRGNARKQCEQFQKDWNKDYRKMSRFVKKHGGNEFTYGAGFQLVGIYPATMNAQMNVKDGWTVPDRRGMTRPKKNTADYAEFKALRLPSPSDFVKELTGVPDTLHYQLGRSSGMSGTSGRYWHCATMQWSGQYILISVANVEKVKSEIKSQYKRSKTFKFIGDSAEWEFSLKGCKQVIEEEYDLLVAKAKLAGK